MPKFRPDKDKKFEPMELTTVPIISAEEYVRRSEARHYMELRHSSLSPGGRQAKRQGCTCPEIHDDRGNCLLYVDGVPMMVYRKGCPVHTPVKQFTDKRLREEIKRLKAEGKKGLYTYDSNTDSFVLVADLNERPTEDQEVQVRKVTVQRGSNNANP